MMVIKKVYEKNIEKASCHWDEHVKLHGESSILINWLDSPLVQDRCLKKLRVGDKLMSVTQWVLWVKEKYVSSRLNYGLSLGCGDGTLERHAISFDICSKFDAYDISGKSIEIAKCLSEKEGLATCINYHVADINNIILDKDKYDIIFVGMAMHHFLNLEHIFEELRKSLKPNGLLIINEFVGPSQFQWTDKQLIIINELLELLPERLKVDVRSGRLKVPVRTPSIESMNENDPSEAIRSSDIIPLVYKMFNVEERIDFGGTILHLLLDAIIANFNPAKEEDIAILRLLGYIEDILIKEKVLSSDFTLIVARNIKPKRKNSVCIYKNIDEKTQRSTLELPVFSRFTLCLKENGLRYTAKRTYIYITKSLWK